eukprot:55183_1
MPPKKAAKFEDLTGDVDKGKNIFISRAAQCHTAEKGGASKQGPPLWGIVGRTAGQVIGYSYSKGNAESGVVWSEQALFDYLENPKKFVPGTKMAFAGLKKPQDRADIIAYMATLKE